MAAVVGIIIFTGILWYVFIAYWPKWVLPKLYSKRSFSLENCYVGDRVDLIWKMGNGSRLPVSWISIKTEFSPEMVFETIQTDGRSLVEYKGIFQMPAQSELKYAYKCAFKKRGFYLFKDVNYQISDYFGINRYEGQFSDKTSIYVYPGIRPVDELLDFSKAYMGSKEVRRWVVEDPLIHMGTRDYTGSEPMKHIHWNATAQTGKLQVKKFSYTTDVSTMFLLNAQTKDQFWQGMEDGLLERMIETVAAYVSSYEKGTENYGFSSNCPVQDGAGGVMIPIARGRKHYHRIFRSLSQITHFTNCRIEEIINFAVKHNTTTTKMVLLTGVMSEELLSTIQWATRKGFHFEILTKREIVEEFGGRHNQIKWYPFKEVLHET